MGLVSRGYAAANALATPRSEHGRRDAPQGAVQAVVVVDLAPVLDGAAHVAKVGEPVPRHVLLSEVAVEVRHLGVLQRFARLYEAQLHATPGRPVLPSAAKELGAVVGADDIGQTSSSLDLIEQLHIPGRSKAATSERLDT